ncbi:MAG TPA: sugar transferase [Actinomycetota bacterium]|nr:sugar transferase [Actinomycetota bacterium]
MARRPIYAAGKRMLDLVVGVLALAVAGPVMAVVAMIVKRDGGPALYRGRRVGRDGAVFRMLKFRTMVVDAEKAGPSSTADDDPRITRIGKRLRAHKLDELPQLLNVIGGSMSLVGPRPQVEHDVAMYTAEERALLSVRPGITDYASIRYRNEGEILKGSADPAEAYNRLIRPGKIALGLEYVRSCSFGTDLKILWLTMLAMVDHDAAIRRLPKVETSDT